MKRLVVNIRQIMVGKLRAGSSCCAFSVGGLGTAMAGSSGISSTIHANRRPSEACRTWLFASDLAKEHAHVIVLGIRWVNANPWPGTVVVTSTDFYCDVSIL